MLNRVSIGIADTAMHLYRQLADFPSLVRDESLAYRGEQQHQLAIFFDLGFVQYRLGFQGKRLGRCTGQLAEQPTAALYPSLHFQEHALYVGVFDDGHRRCAGIGRAADGTSLEPFASEFD